MEHEIWCLYGNILILLPHSSTYTLVKCRKVSVDTIIDLYIHQYNNTDIWEPPNWSTYCLMFNVVTFSHDYLRQQRSQNPMNSSCCNTCQTWTKWCNKSLVTRLIFFSVIGGRNRPLKHESPKPYTVVCSLQEKQTTVAYSFSRNKTFDPVNHTSTGQTGFLGSYPKQVHCLHKAGLLAVVVNVSDCEILNSGNAGKSGCIWNRVFRYYFIKLVFVFHTLSSVYK